MRIGIVNDMPIAREMLRRAVGSTPAHQVAWLARDGGEAVAKAEADRPDLILMDLIMPGVDGVEATRKIMKQSPCAIVIVTSSVHVHMGRVYEAINLGALDAVDTPEVGPDGDMAGARVLLDKIGTIAKLLGKSTSIMPDPSRSDRHRPMGEIPPSWPLIAIGSSTGGPAALATILEHLPNTRDAATVLVQHLDSAFVPGLAQWLTERSGRRVDLAESGLKPMPGQVLLASTNDHIAVDADCRLQYVAEPMANPFRPSVDVFFRSVARHWPEPGAAALLTGMMRDGAEGLLALRKAGWLTIAQDKATSIIWGMPGAAVEIGAADLVLPLPEIAGAIADRVRDRSHRMPGDPHR